MTDPMWITAIILILAIPGADLEEQYQKKLAAIEEGDAKGHLKLGEWCKRAGMKDRALEHLQKVVEIDPENEDALLALERIEVGWDFKGRIDTEHFRIWYGTKKKVAEELGEYGESLYASFHETFEEVGDLGSTLPLKVFVFRKKGEYRAYAEARAPYLGKHLYPQFDPGNRTAYICQEDSSEDFLVQSFIHENTHALSGRVMWYCGGEGAWLAEGWADYMQMSVDFKKKKVLPGLISQTEKSRHPDVVKRLMREGKLIPLADLIAMDRPALARAAMQTWPQAWSLFHFLCHCNSGAYRESFLKYIALAAEGKGGKAAFEETIAPIETIAEEWREYARTLTSGKVRK